MNATRETVKPRCGSVLVRFVAESVGEILFAGHMLGSHPALRDPGGEAAFRIAAKGLLDLLSDYQIDGRLEAVAR